MATNTINWGKIYESSWWGIGVSTNTISWGSIYRDFSSNISFLAEKYTTRVEADGGVVESINCVSDKISPSSNWNYYFRVTEDNGIVESINCINV